MILLLSESLECYWTLEIIQDRKSEFLLCVSQQCVLKTNAYSFCEILIANNIYCNSSESVYE